MKKNKRREKSEREREKSERERREEEEKEKERGEKKLEIINKDKTLRWSARLGWRWPRLALSSSSLTSSISSVKAEKPASNL